MTRSVPTIAVVGAGTAGCTVARRLVEARRSKKLTANIVLIERGADNPHHDNKNFMSSLETDAVSHVPADISVGHQHAIPYIQGHCVGGGGAVNAMVVSPINSADFNAWSDEHGCAGWSFDVLQGNVSDILPTEMLDLSDVGDVGAALIAAGGQPTRMTWNGARVSGKTMVTPLLTSGDLQLIQDEAKSIVIENGLVRGVRTNSQTIPADVVVMTAGSVMTPLLLRESGVSHPFLGRNAQDHPAVFFTMPRNEGSSDSFVATSLLSKENSQVIAYETANASSRDYGMLSVSLLNVKSRGEVTGTVSNPRLHLNLLQHPSDRQLMREALRAFLTEVAPVFVQRFQHLFCDHLGTDALALLALSDAACDEWLVEHVVPHSHISGTCAMGSVATSVVTPRGQVPAVGGLYVADTSVFPVIPRSNTNLVSSMVASQIAAFLVEDMA